MTPLTQKTAIANIPAAGMNLEIPTQHAPLAASSASHQLDCYIDAQLLHLAKRFEAFQTHNSRKHSMGR